MKLLIVKIADCSYADLIRTAERCGFVIRQGKGHCKVETTDGKWITTIPRHERIKRETARGIAKKFQEFGAEIVIR